MNQTTTAAGHGATQQIPSDQWVTFLAGFTRENRGAHATMEVVGPSSEIGYQVETENQPFDGISADLNDRECTVWISFGSGKDDHLTHGISSAIALRVLPATGTKGAVLEVEASDGTRTILELSNAEEFALPLANS